MQAATASRLKRLETVVEDVSNRSDWEEPLRLHQGLAKSKLGDMAGCLQGRVEARLSQLHATLHEQIEKAHLRADSQQRELYAAEQR